MKKIYVVILCALLIIFTGVGMVLRSTYESFGEMDNPLSGMMVAEISSTLLESQANVAQLDLMLESKYILAVECTGELDFYYNSAVQKCKVVSVFKGKDISEGEEIEIVRSTSINTGSDFDGTAYEGENSIALSFTNEMKIGEVYLVFLNHKIANSENMYIDPQFIFSHIYSYNYTDNTAKELINDMATYVYYDDVCDNEYFLVDDSENEIIKEIKDYLFEKFPIEK